MYGYGSGVGAGVGAGVSDGTAVLDTSCCCRGVVSFVSDCRPEHATNEATMVMINSTDKNRFMLFPPDRIKKGKMK